MLYPAVKAVLSGLIIAIVSEMSKRSPALGALVVSLPMVSILSVLSLWKDTGDQERIASHMVSTVWGLAQASLHFWLPSRPQRDDGVE